MKYDVVIVGAGLGGLECGLTLAKNGLSVCVLEQQPVLGGCLQIFKRKKCTFDTGFHYIGGLSEGQHLNRLFHYFGLMDLPWHKLDEDCFDEVIFHGKSYAFANGYEHFVETLSKDFPHQRENLKRYVDTLSAIGKNIFKSFEPRSAEDFYQAKPFTTTAYEFLKETISDPILRNVLAGTSLKMELHKELPLYIFAQINDSFIQSAWRIEGGGMQIAEKLAENIARLNGVVKRNAKVDELIEEGENITRAKLSNGEEIEGKWFISNIHPAATLQLVKNSKKIKNIYKRRINNIPNTFGMFTANIQLKKDSIPYQNRNQYIYETDELWNFGEYKGSGKVNAVLVSYQCPKEEGKTTDNIDLLTPMNWQEVEQWKDTSLMHRGADYEQFKQGKAEECLQLAGKHISGLCDSVENIYTSTPLTYQYYTNTMQGSAYGMLKDRSKLAYTMLTPKTPIANLLLTGQNLNLHGILGVSMTSFFTCAEIIGMEKVRKDIGLE